ncbi:MAG: hypothetical protein KDA93_24350 [Planctomycetaceae bacterium]|nr:hypothetical protein [Planctomycetaceae bacterium]
MNTVNRMAALIIPKAPYFAWSRDVLGDDLPPDEPDAFRTVFLLPERSSIERAFRTVFRDIFEELLQASVNAPELWPEKRDLRTFRQWFDVQLVELVHDAGLHEPIHDEP